MNKKLFFLSSLSGIFYSFSFEPFNFIFSFFIAIFIIYFLSSQNNNKILDIFKKNIYISAFFIGFYTLISLHWVFYGPLKFEKLWIFAPFALILVFLYLYFFFILFLNIFTFSVFILEKIKINNFFIRFFRPIIFSSFFILFFEIFRTYGKFSFPLNFISSIFLDIKIARHIISIYNNSFIFGFIIMLLISYISEFIVCFYEKKIIHGILIFQLSIIHIIFFMYYFSYEENKKDLSKKEEYIIRVLNSNIDQKEKLNNKISRENIIKNISMTFRNNSSKISYFIWPETSFGINIEINKNLEIIKKNDFINYLTSFLNKDQFIILGAILKQNNRIYNSIIMINNESKIISIYKKQRLVPFGEFIPFININKIIKSYTSFDANLEDKKTILKSKYINFYPLICFEAIFPFKKNKIKDLDFDIILNLSNYAWFDKKFASKQHERNIRLRSIESGKILIHSSNGGISSIISKDGEILEAISEFGYIDFVFKK